MVLWFAPSNLGTCLFIHSFILSVIQQGPSSVLGCSSTAKAKNKPLLLQRKILVRETSCMSDRTAINPGYSHFDWKESAWGDRNAGLLSVYEAVSFEGDDLAGRHYSKSKRSSIKMRGLFLSVHFIKRYIYTLNNALVEPLANETNNYMQ